MHFVDLAILFCLVASLGFCRLDSIFYPMTRHGATGVDLPIDSHEVKLLAFLFQPALL